MQRGQCMHYQCLVEQGSRQPVENQYLNGDRSFIDRIIDGQGQGVICTYIFTLCPLMKGLISAHPTFYFSITPVPLEIEMIDGNVILALSGREQYPLEGLYLNRFAENLSIDGDNGNRWCVVDDSQIHRLDLAPHSALVLYLKGDDIVADIRETAYRALQGGSITLTE